MLNHETTMPFQSQDMNQKTISIHKGTPLQMEGDSKIKFYFVVKGLLRSYVIDEKGKEHTFMFAPENWFIGDSFAFVKKQPTKIFIDALEDSEVVVYQSSKISEDTVLTTSEYKSEMNKLLNRVGVLQERILMQLSTSALTRYQHFAKTYPQILERVPQKMIATYLGITPEALSKVRGDWVKSK